MLTQKCYTQAIQQLGEKANIPEFLMFKCAQSKVTVKTRRYLFAFPFNNNLKNKKLNSLLSRNKLPVPAKFLYPYTLRCFTKVEILSGFMQNLTIHDRLYCDAGRLSEKGRFGFAPQIHFPILVYAKILQ